MKDGGQKETKRQGGRRKLQRVVGENDEKKRRRRRRGGSDVLTEGRCEGCEIAGAKKGGGDCISEVGGSQDEKCVKVDLL